MLSQPFEIKSRSKMTTMIYSSEINLTVFSEAVRKEAYAKASLDHKQSKDKKDIFLEKNDKKYGD